MVPLLIVRATGRPWWAISANIVTAVLLDFRAYDTLGEATVLFCAVVGALTVMRRQAKQSAEEEDKEDET